MTSSLLRKWKVLERGRLYRRAFPPIGDFVVDNFEVAAAFPVRVASGSIKKSR
jgi:hypothetical protein